MQDEAACLEFWWSSADNLCRLKSALTNLYDKVPGSFNGFKDCNHGECFSCACLEETAINYDQSDIGDAATSTAAECRVRMLKDLALMIRTLLDLSLQILVAVPIHVGLHPFHIRRCHVLSQELRLWQSFNLQ